jgi:hypothetical protein
MDPDVTAPRSASGVAAPGSAGAPGLVNEKPDERRSAQHDEADSSASAGSVHGRAQIAPEQPEPEPAAPPDAPKSGAVHTASSQAATHQLVATGAPWVAEPLTDRHGPTAQTQNHALPGPTALLNRRRFQKKVIIRQDPEEAGAPHTFEWEAGKAVGRGISKSEFVAYHSKSGRIKTTVAKHVDYIVQWAYAKEGIPRANSGLQIKAANEVMYSQLYRFYMPDIVPKTYLTQKPGRWAIVSSILLLAACGGGDGNFSPTPAQTSAADVPTRGLAAGRIARHQDAGLHAQTIGPGCA